MKSLKEEENERALKQQDEILTMHKDDVAQVNKTFKIPQNHIKTPSSTSKRLSTQNSQNGKNSTNFRVRETPSRRISKQSTIKSLSASRKLVTSKSRESLASTSNSNKKSTGTTRTKSRQSVAPIRQSNRSIIRSTRLNNSF